jgi:phosphotransferase system HPr-like phosphotransfer protein
VNLSSIDSEHKSVQKRVTIHIEGSILMKTVQISLNSIDKVKSFVFDLTKYDYDFDLVSGRYVIDAKSIMGIFSLDLSKPIDLNIHAEDNVETILETLKPYIVNE